MLFNNLYCVVYFIFHIKSVMSFSLSSLEKESKKENRSITLVTESNASLTSLNDMYNGVYNNNTKIRIKRQTGGAGKFTDAAKMPQVKALRLFMQMFKNFWDVAYVGGTHPLHPDVPKVVIALYKQKIVEFFIPDVGEDPDKQSA